MIRINCFFQAHEDKYNEALEVALALTAASQKDNGVVSYDCFESATRPDVFMICETWKSVEELNEHKQTEHFRTYVAQLEQLGLLKIEQLDM